MIQPIGDKILLEPLATEEFTSGGLALPDTAKTTPDRGTVLEVGEDVKSVAKGQVALFRKGVGIEVKDEGKKFIILPLKEVIGLIKEGK